MKKISKKINWQRYFARKFSAQRYEIVMNVYRSDFMRKNFGVRLKNSLVIPENKNHAIYYDSEEWPEFEQKVFKKSCRDLKTFNFYKQIIKRDQKEYVDIGNRIRRLNLEKESNDEIKKLYLKFTKANQDFFNSAIWIPFISEPLIMNVVKDNLIKLLNGVNKADKLVDYLEIIFSPEKKNAIVSEREDLLKIALAYKEKKINKISLEKLLQKHLQKFQWIPCYDIYDSPWTFDYFKNELQQFLSADYPVIKELQEIKNRFISNKKRFKLLLEELKPTLKQKELFVIAHDLTFIKDERDDYRRQGSFLIQPLFIEIGRRAGLNLREVTHLLQREVLQFLENNKLPSKREIELRVKGYVLIRKGGEIAIYSGKKIKKIISQELGDLKKKEISEVKGIVGCQGKTTGNVQLIITKHDLRKIKEGDIMVAVTTHPDFVPAMRKCKAIVTDEGAITCHAAIVARELKIPCVVGTKDATKVFKDGEKVEVDAEKGVVKKLE